jgi:hypothetical protein
MAGSGPCSKSTQIIDGTIYLMSDDAKQVFDLIDAGANAANQKLEADALGEALDLLLAPELSAILSRTDEVTRRRYLDYLRDYTAFARRGGVNPDLPISGQSAGAWIVHKFISEKDIARARERVRAVSFLNETDAYCEAAVTWCKLFGPGGGGGIPEPVVRCVVDNSSTPALAAAAI